MRSPRKTFPESRESLLAKLAAHQAARPDHLAALQAGIEDPKSALYQEWRSWCAEKTALHERIARTENGWGKASGEVAA